MVSAAFVKRAAFGASILLGLLIVFLLDSVNEPIIIELTTTTPKPLPTTTPLPVVTSLEGIQTSLLKPSSDYLVPNILHYVYFSDGYEPLKFHEFLAIKSAENNLKPEKIIFHCDHEPTGKTGFRISYPPSNQNLNSEYWF